MASKLIGRRKRVGARPGKRIGRRTVRVAPPLTTQGEAMEVEHLRQTVAMERAAGLMVGKKRVVVVSVPRRRRRGR